MKEIYRVSLLIALLSAAWCPTAQASRVIQAPPFDLQDIANQTHISLADAHGKALVVTFLSTDCQPTRRELPLVEDVFKHRDAHDVMVLGIALDISGPHELRKLLADTSVTFPIAAGTTDVGTAFMGICWAFPTVFVFDRTGRFMERILGVPRGGEAAFKSRLEDSIDNALTPHPLEQS